MFLSCQTGIVSSNHCLVSFSKSSTNNSSFLLHYFARNKKKFYVSGAILSGITSKSKCSGKMTKQSECLQHIFASNLTYSKILPLFYVLCATVSLALSDMSAAPLLPGTALLSRIHLRAELIWVPGLGIVTGNEVAGAQMRKCLNKPLHTVMLSITGGCFKDTG